MNQYTPRKLRKTSRLIRSTRRRRNKRPNPFVIVAKLFVAFLFFLVLLNLGMFLLGMGTMVSAATYFTSDLPDFTDLERIGFDTEDSFETTKIYAWGTDEDGDGQRDPVLIYEIIDPLEGDRQWISFDQISKDFVNATISIEDKSFWENAGYDLEGIGRAGFQYIVKGGAIQGGSSITQQVVKNNLIDVERRVIGEEVELDDYRRKVEEMILSSRVSQVYTKEQIMEWYLNTNFYGNLAYGIEAAARVYFDKTSTQLTLAESAMLSAIPQSPAFNPIHNPEQAKKRQELVLRAMFREGYIDREMMIAAIEEPIETRSSLAERFDIIAPHYALYVRKQLEERFGTDQVLRGGLQVQTALDLRWQQQAECVARVQVGQLSDIPRGETLAADEQETCEALKYLPKLPNWAPEGDLDANNASVVMIDPRTGELKAMVGSLDYYNDEIDGEFNVAADGLRQPGSSFKPFTYLAALQAGYQASSLTLDVETDFGTPYNGVAYVPQNYDRSFHGLVRMRDALANSFNVTAVEAMTWVGVDTVIRLAHEMGITTLEDVNNYGLSLTLGGGEVKLLDMTYAFTPFANKGLLVGETIPTENQRLGFRTLDPVSILEVTTRRGNVLYRYEQPEFEQVITPEQAFIMADMMSDEEARCFAFGCPNSLQLSDYKTEDHRVAAAKTGTTNGYKDAWTIGYTPQLVTGVWVGNTDNTSMKEVPGSLGAAPIWRALMNWALEDEPKLEFEPPVGVHKIEVCRLNGMLPSRDCRDTINEWMIRGQEPTEIDNMHQRVRLNRETGQLATSATPPELVYEKVFISYPERASDWARETKQPKPPTQFDGATIWSGDIGNAVILSPEPFSFVRDRIDVIGMAKSPEFKYYNLSYISTYHPNDVHGVVSFVGETKQNQELAKWNSRAVPDGPYELILQIFNQDKVVVEEARTQVTVDNTPPSARIAFPIPNQKIFVDAEFVVIQAQAIDTYAIEKVEFFVDNSEVPFAINTVPPFTEKWNIPGPGCHSFRVHVTDGAGNEKWSDSVRTCFEKREE